ncbi:ParB/RepB/Spo0J family partition protein [Vibrio europaeus]|uniref:ParB/RepB/Spo0J family partition protein n=1 Tax=Vibrio europaeus TaxID=300876 RepID=UPI00233ECBED|nr:ParB/RepB/Spo0J family partition protein [Vibrio europaeus]MDC5753545.1 ParB/RepB/Spo0J family partition protein [Vibrio europaeus]MDC5816543.1 ParB/RepB/Spo0J family partition protein [Vibrio europaeus]
MAKKNATSGMMLSGVSDASVKEAVSVAELRVGQKSMMPVGDEMAEFELACIPHHDITKKTYVLDDNARMQSALNEVSLNDILPSLNEKGMQYPARGYIDPTGKIEVWDGSRRRMGCIISKRDYFIWVTKKQVSDDTKRLMSDVGNYYKPLSLYERGALWEKMLDEEKYQDAKHLAEGEGTSEAVVTSARKAFALPEGLVNLMPSINDLGRPAINEIHKRIKPLKEGELGCVLDELKNVHLGSLIEEHGTKDGRRLNSELLTQFYALLPEPPAKKAKKASDVQDQQIIVPVAIPEGLKKVAMVDSGKQKAYIVEEGRENEKSALIELSGISNAVLEDIYNFISNKLDSNVEQEIDHEDKPADQYH